MAEREILYLNDASAWAAWLSVNHASSDGVLLAIAKKGSNTSSISYAEALDEALCYGWIDGKRMRLDERFFLQTFTPRRRGSLWSQVNREKVTVLTAAGRMKASGLAAVEEAKGNGRWEAAYASQASMVVPEDLVGALKTNPAAWVRFEGLSRSEQYSLVFQVVNSRRPEVRARRVSEVVTKLSS